MIPESALKISQITWPAKYVQRGAQVVKNPSDVLRILAENDIFKIDPVQQTLNDYLTNISQKVSKTKKSNG